MIVRPTCFLCSRPMIPIEGSLGFQWHERADDCHVECADRYGVSVEESEIVWAKDESEETLAPIDDPDILSADTFPHVEQVLIKAFKELGLPRLGGQSTGRGWSNVSLFQKCPYAWKIRYFEPLPENPLMHLIVTERDALAIGTLIHTFLALHYSNMVAGFAHHSVTPEWMRDRLMAEANPKLVKEGWRCFVGYRLFYQNEEIVPLAVEYDLKDPRTNASSRPDLIAFFPNDTLMRPSGTYMLEHKSAARFDRPTLEGWPNDGEVLGQILGWKKMKLDKRFGELQGVMVNIIGKQEKEQKFHRMTVRANAWPVAAHERELKEWEGLIQLAVGMRNFPRARHSCVGRYGMCDHFDHCATGE